jgi:cyclic pyranopterin phosphate synthase
VRRITCRDALPKVQEGLQAAKAAGFDPIKINMVVMAGVNDDEVEAMVEFCAGQGFILRLIEAMPVGQAGAGAPYADLQPIRERVAKRFALVPGVVRGAGPARYLRSADNRIRVGFITAMSQHFCAACNRVRLDVEGTLHTCLGHEHCTPLRQLVRGGADEHAIEGAIRRAIAAKPERHAFRDARAVPLRSMAKTGG